MLESKKLIENMELIILEDLKDENMLLDIKQSNIFHKKKNQLTQNSKKILEKMMQHEQVQNFFKEEAVKYLENEDKDEILKGQLYTKSNSNDEEKQQSSKILGEVEEQQEEGSIEGELEGIGKGKKSKLKTILQKKQKRGNKAKKKAGMSPNKLLKLNSLFGIHFDSSKSGKSPDKKNKNKGKHSRVRWQGRNKLTPVRRGLMFGFGPFILKSILTYNLLMSYELLKYYNNSIFADQIINYSEIVTLGSFSWAGCNKLTYAAAEVVTWNDTSILYGQKKALTAFNDEVKDFRTNVLANMTRHLKSDLGKYTEEYRKAMIGGNTCGQAVLKNKTTEMIYCDRLFGGALKQGIIPALSETVNLAVELVKKWEDVRGDSQKVKELMNTNTFGSYFGKFNIYLKDLLYFLLDTPNEMLLTAIESDRSHNEDYRVYVTMVRVVILLYYIIFVMVFQVQKIVERLTSPFRLLPVDVVIKNTYLVNVLLSKQ